ncbi:MAG: site-specific DNA-methyltransferase [Verrucomicrobia bacterium]|nr:site-specific DNA-methyltransferase [Verrucomicrobiota bacterium]
MPTSSASFTSFELHLGDCLAGMQNLPDASIDLVVTSPPYNLGISYSTYDDTLGREEYLAWTRAWAGQVARILKPGGSFFLNAGAVPSNPLLPHQILLALVPGLFQLQNTFHWIKSITVDTRDGEEISAGHFKPINSRRYVNDCHEYLYHLTLDGGVPLDRRAVGVAYVHKSNIARWGHTGGQDKRCRGNNWFIPYETIMRRDTQRPHPATFPVALAARCIAVTGLPPAEITMLDPFLGIGHAALAAREAAVARFIGFEIDEDYLNEANHRLAATDHS